MSEIEARMQRMGLQILAEHPDGLRGRELWPMVAERLPTIEDEFGAVTTGSTTAAQKFDWSSIGLVKAGWLTRSGGRWFATSAARMALDRLPEPESFFDEVGRRYKYWEKNRSRFVLAKQFIEAIPAGSWVPVAGLARETGLDADALVQWLQGERPEGWWRVLDGDGRLPAAAHAIGAARDSWLGMLDDDGIDVGQGRAEPVASIPASDLREIVPGEDSPRRAWLVRGSDVQGKNLIRQTWLPDGICSLPASRLRDLPPGASIDDVRAAVDQDYAHENAQDRARLTAEYQAFLARMREDDIVVTNDGSAVFLGVITGLPVFVSSVGQAANLQRPVRWHNADRPLDYADDLPDEFSARLGNPDAQVIELTELVQELQQLLGEPAMVAPREFRLPDAGSGLAERLLVPPEWLQECVEMLRERPQLIFYGPPGTGKTYLAQHLAEHLTGGKPENVQLVQFHPAYSYEDFFEGYRPRKGADGTVGFDLVRGPFRRLVAAALQHPGEPYVLIIDEINRGNLAKIFGELYFLLEYRGKGVNLLYGSDEGRGFSLPRNVIIIGTMNTADRSIALVDAAMRRRFWFAELHPDEPPTRDMLALWLKSQGQPDDLARLLAELNGQIEDRDFRIGPSYLMREAATTEAGLRRIWQKQILPLLEEHHYGDGLDVRRRYELDALLGRLP